MDKCDLSNILFLFQALQKAKDSLQVLYCIIELTILEVPKITNLIPFDASHIEQLNRRAL